jgi:hypothetical protein
MPWHRLGTVSVTLNSSTVTGVGTGFAANARIGDAFIGPDGRQYELGNVASDTVISIIPAYLGPTASGAAYAIVPVQGYQKGLADQVRDWVNTYGAKMAALGTTGNYDILPVTKGGTGGTDQASARTGLAAAKSGSNSDITALTSMTTALSVEQGGTGGKTPADARAGIGLGPTASLAIGSIEVTAATPFIDFHFNNSVSDYDVRLINSAAGTLNALVTNPNEFRINGFTAWNDSNCGNKLGSISVGGVGSYGFFLTNTGLTPGTTIAGGNLQYAFAVGNGQTSPTGLWRCMGDTTAGQRTLFQRVS